MSKENVELHDRVEKLDPLDAPAVPDPEVVASPDTVLKTTPQLPVDEKSGRAHKSGDRNRHAKLSAELNDHLAVVHDPDKQTPAFAVDREVATQRASALRAEISDLESGFDDDASEVNAPDRAEKLHDETVEAAERLRKGGRYTER